MPFCDRHLLPCYPSLARIAYGKDFKTEIRKIHLIPSFLSATLCLNPFQLQILNAQDVLYVAADSYIERIRKPRARRTLDEPGLS